MTEIEQREYISHIKAEWDREGQLDDSRTLVQICNRFLIVLN